MHNANSDGTASSKSTHTNAADTSQKLHIQEDDTVNTDPTSAPVIRSDTQIHSSTQFPYAAPNQDPQIQNSDALQPIPDTQIPNSDIQILRHIAVSDGHLDAGDPTHISPRQYAQSASHHTDSVHHNARHNIDSEHQANDNHNVPRHNTHIARHNIDSEHHAPSESKSHTRITADGHAIDSHHSPIISGQNSPGHIIDNARHIYSSYPNTQG